MIKRSRLTTPLLILIAAAAIGACQDEEETTTEPIFASTTEPTVQPMDLEPEEEPEAEPEDEPEEPKRKGPYRPADPMGIAKCCSALRNNMKAAPEEQKGNYQLAISSCEAARKNPALISSVRRYVPGAPVICK